MPDAFGDRVPEPFAFFDASDPDRALSAGQQGEIGRGVGDHLTDPLALDRPSALTRDAVLVRDVVVVAVVVRDDHEQRDIVRDRGPQRGEPHEVIAVAEHRYRQPAAAAQG